MTHAAAGEHVEDDALETLFGIQEEEHEPSPDDGPREKLYHLLHDMRLQAFLLVLLLIDVLIVMAEMNLSMSTRDRIESLVCDSHAAQKLTTVQSFHSHDLSHAKILTHNLPEGCTVKLVAYLTPAVHIAEKALGGMSIAILVIFEIELLLTAYCIGRAFFKMPWMVLDAAIVTVSLVLDVINTLDPRLASLGVVLVLFRLWRLARIFHGIGTAVSKKHKRAELHKANSKAKMGDPTVQNQESIAGSGGPITVVKARSG